MDPAQEPLQKGKFNSCSKTTWTLKSKMNEPVLRWEGRCRKASEGAHPARPDTLSALYIQGWVLKAQLRITSRVEEHIKAHVFRNLHKAASWGRKAVSFPSSRCSAHSPSKVSANVVKNRFLCVAFCSWQCCAGDRHSMCSSEATKDIWFSPQNSQFSRILETLIKYFRSSHTVSESRSWLWVSSQCSFSSHDPSEVQCGLSLILLLQRKSDLSFTALLFSCPRRILAEPPVPLCPFLFPMMAAQAVLLWLVGNVLPVLPWDSTTFPGCCFPRTLITLAVFIPLSKNPTKPWSKMPLKGGGGFVYICSILLFFVTLGMKLGCLSWNPALPCPSLISVWRRFWAPHLPVLLRALTSLSHLF